MSKPFSIDDRVRMLTGDIRELASECHSAGYVAGHKDGRELGQKEGDGQATATLFYDQGVEAGIDKGYAAAKADTDDEIRQLKAVLDGKNTTIENMGKELDKLSRQQTNLLNENAALNREWDREVEVRKKEEAKVETLKADLAQAHADMHSLREYTRKLEALCPPGGAHFSRIWVTDKAVCVAINGVTFSKDMSATGMLNLSRRLADMASELLIKQAEVRSEAEGNF